MDRQLEARPNGFSALQHYIRIARPDHWFKNIFMLPGIIFAVYDLPHLLSWDAVPSIVLGTIAACLVASSNYTINEILDAPKDCLHPVKKNRPIPCGLVDIRIAYAQWILLAVAGMAVGALINRFFFISLALLLVMGFLYNIPPIRLKDAPYFDVLSESVNNPIRLLLGWFMVNTLYPPTLSLIMAYWMIGAFFMAMKRYAEYRKIGDPEIAEGYRKSFGHYNEYRLLLSIIYYASAFSLFFGIFIVRYRIEMILSVPFIAGFISMYLRLGFREDSPVQYPEHLYKQKSLVIYCLFCLALLMVLLFVDLPFVEQLFHPVHMPGR